MTSRIPEPPSQWEAEGLPDPGDTSEGQAASGDTAYGMEPPHDTGIAVDEYGTTAEEQHDGEPLDTRLAREEPEVLAAADTDADEGVGSETPFDEAAGQNVGRLVEPDEGARADAEPDMVASDRGTDMGGYTAEESAMHLEPEV